MHTALHPTGQTATRPSAGRRVAIAVAGFLACALPVTFTITISGMLLLGKNADHRFHQLTGQGLLLFVLWFSGLVPLLRAGWAGRRPSTGAGLRHLTFAVVGTLCSVAAPQGGAPILMGVIVVTGALVWLAIPRRPAFPRTVRIDPVLAPLALLGAALNTSYALGQIALQHDATGHHAQNPHYFDMAWLVLALSVFAILAAVLPAARGLALWSGAGLAWCGAVGVALGEELPWAALALVVGLATVAGERLTRRSAKPASGAAAVL